MRVALFCVFYLIGQFGFSQSIIGKWKSIDDVSGKPRSIVEIYERSGRIYGKVLKVFPEPDEHPDPICEKCSGSKKDQKIVGMEIITDMKFNANDQGYEGGQILDPESGSIYDCKLWISEGKLMVRGYLFWFYRTQTWLPANE